MTCPSCSRAAGPQDRFCAGCGTLLGARCPRCGRRNSHDGDFCTACGASLRETGPSPHEDRRPVTVLFIDMVHFTSYAAQADPEQVRARQHEYFTTASRIIRQHGGVVEKYIGDAVMAIFGAPVATENDALRCVMTGLELQRVLGRHGTRFRVGIASGEALVDLAAARDGGQAIASGDVVNTAARLQAVAPPGGVLVCATTHRATADDVDYAPPATRTLRGHSRPSETWLALSARRRENGDDEPSPMVGREHEFGLLVTALERCLDGRVPQLVTVFGAAGIGKSRLLRELGRRRSGDVAWHIGHCRPFGENVTFAALGDVVKARVGILDSDDESAAGRRLRAAVAELFPAAETDPLVEAMRPLVGLPAARVAVERADTEAAWRRFILAMAAQRPTVIVFEDMHWADDAMLHFVEVLGGAVHRLPLFVVATARPELRERRPEWTSAITGAMSINLTPIHDDDIAAVYRHMLGDLVDPVTSIPPLVELAGGNPLYAHEYARMLIEGGGRIRPPAAPAATDAPPMPQTVQAVIANRLDLLDPGDRTLLQTAAVVGAQFWPGALAAATGLPDPRVEQALHRLEQRDLVEEQPASTMAGQTEYRFRHILVRDVCYQRLPRGSRVSLHQRVADWLERVGEGRQAELAEVLAHHRWAAHEIARTVGWDPAPYAPAARAALHRAARRAYALNALDTANTLVDRALGLKLPADPALELFAAELSLYRDSDGFLSDGGQSQLAELAAELTAAGDRAGAARAWTLLATAAWSRADHAEAVRCLDRASRLYATLPDSGDKASALLELARVHYINGETPTAIEAAKAGAELADRLGLVEAGASARITLAAACYLSGADGGLRQLDEITEHCRTHGLVSLRRAMQNLAWAMQEEGDLTGSMAIVDELGAMAHGGGHALATSFAERFGRAYFAGDWAEAITIVSSSLRQPTAEWELHLVAVLGWMRVLRVEPVPEVDLDRAVTAARRSGFHRVLRSTLAHAALCRALQGRAGDAHGLLAELAEDWTASTTIAFGEWAAGAAHAAAVVGGPTRDLVRGMLERSSRRTPWVAAALETVAEPGADPVAHHLRAAAIYARIGAESDRALALAAAARLLPPDAAPPLGGDVVEALGAFAARNAAPGLLPGVLPGGPDRPAVTPGT